MKQERRKPYGEEYKTMAKEYKSADHEGKLHIAARYGVTLDSLKHWVSDGQTEPTAYAQPTSYEGISHPLNLDITSKPTTLAIINDTHNPFQDRDALALTETVLQEIKPDYIVYNGDVNDFYQLSTFDKNPERANSLQDDINSTIGMFVRHVEMFPLTKKIMLMGNHEDRLRKFLWSKSPALGALDALSLEELFHLKDFEIQLVPYEQGVMVNGVFLIIHGDLASQHSSYTAKSLFDKHGGCGIAGHSHRGGSFYKRDRFGTHGWYENFCLCRLDPDWVKNPNWQQGFSLVHFHGKHFWIEQVPIIDKELIYGGKRYKV